MNCVRSRRNWSCLGDSAPMRIGIDVVNHYMVLQSYIYIYVYSVYIYVCVCAISLIAYNYINIYTVYIHIYNICYMYIYVCNIPQWFMGHQPLTIPLLDVSGDSPPKKGPSKWSIV
jgi:hypothetical protein